MPAIYLQHPLKEKQTTSLKEEFTTFEFLSQNPDWSQVEILFGNKLDEATLKKAHRLKWIHTPSKSLERLAIKQIKEQEQIFLTITKGQNVTQIAEFVMGGILAFAKQFFHWPKAPHDPQEFWNWPLKETMWTLNNHTLLQIGLGNVGSAIVQLANSFGMKTWGIDKQRSFHPHCHKTFAIGTLNSLLPAVDVVVLSLPQHGFQKPLFSKEQFELMKNDSILIVVGSASALDIKELACIAKSGKFRGVLLDAAAYPPPTKASPLWGLPNVILTPAVASYPETDHELAFQTFRDNLRAYVLGKSHKMRYSL